MRIALAAPIVTLALTVALAACDYPDADKPRSVSDLGIATPAHPVVNTARLENPPGAPVRVAIPSPAVSRATDAGGQDEGGVVEPRM